jgi:hypothetical protein
MMLCSWRQQAPLFFKHAKCCQIVMVC